MGLLTDWRCLTSQGGRVVLTVAVFLVLSIRLSWSRVLRGGSMEERNSMGSESPWWISGM